MFLAATLQPDARIVAAGLAGGSNIAVARFSPDGLIDQTFSGDGSLSFGFSSTTEGAAVALQPDGKIVAVGGSDTNAATCVVRVNGAFGSPDSDFGDRGILVAKLVEGPSPATALALQLDGKFVVAGAARATGRDGAFVARFGLDGKLDDGFGEHGLAMPATGTALSEFRSVALDADGRIVATGFRTGSTDELLLYRFWP